jgi:hypothetical protein
MRRDMETLPWQLLFNQKPALFALPDTDQAILERWKALLDALSSISILRIDEVGGLSETIRGELAALEEQLVDDAGPAEALHEARAWCRRLAEAVMAMQMQMRPLSIGLQSLEEQAEAYLQAMDFRFLYESQRQVFHIGYNLVADKLDNSYYDLLASEARIASIVAIEGCVHRPLAAPGTPGDPHRRSAGVAVLERHHV